jgi:hypothetical protein
MSGRRVGPSGEMFSPAIDVISPLGEAIFISGLIT